MKKEAILNKDDVLIYGFTIYLYFSDNRVFVHMFNLNA